MSSPVYFLVGGEASEAEADGTVRLSGGEAEGAQDVRGFGDAGGAGGTGGGGEVGLEGGEQILGDLAESYHPSILATRTRRIN